jgi:long-chain acyl-CoA synthetase
VAAPGTGAAAGHGTIELLSAATAEDRQRRVAGSLLAAGLVAGDRVVLSAPSSGHLLCATLGALRVGIVPVVLNATLLPEEQAVLVADCDPGLVVEGTDALVALAAGDPVELSPVPLARPMHYTSGTTGRPKGVWSGVLGPAEAQALVDEEAQLWGFAADDVNLVCSPLHHSAPIRFAAGTLLAGGDVVILPHFEVGAFAEAVTAFAPTTAFMVPAHLQRLFAAGPLPELDSFRLLAHAGAPCPPALKQAAIEAFPAGAVWEFYGSTEGQFTVSSTDDWITHPGTVGRARPGRRLRIEVPDDDDVGGGVPATGRPAAPGEIGVIWCEVPAHARFEYWRDPARTAASWHDGAFSVGDLGHLDADGYLHLSGRRDDLIISGGVNVYPAEVELVLGGCPGVDEVAVFGVADERWGQRVCAAVVGGAEPEAVLAYARAHLAPYKRPKEVVRVAELPLTSTGKIRRSTLAADLGVEPAEGGAAASP